MKRKLEEQVQCKKAEEVKQRSAAKHGGDGVAWFRGPMIGKGNFGSVYLANSKKPRKRFACYPETMAVKSAEMSVSGSIQKEREALSNIGRCPNIIRCFGEEITTGEYGQMVYNLLLEYGAGGTLADLIKKSGGSGLPESDVRYYAKLILLGINHIHELGYVHCDLKPENILLVANPNGAKFKVKIGDFGLAKRATQNKKRKLDPYLRGTPMYLSPEVVVDCIQEPPSDIWAFGCIVLEMLTGKPPWAEKQHLDEEDLLRQIGECYEMPKIPSEISRDGRQFLKGCFSRKSMYRFTAEMLLNHSYMEGCVDDDGDEVEEEEEILVADEVDSSLMVSEIDEECSCSSYYDDCSFESDEESFLSSCSEEEEEEEEEEESESEEFSGLADEGTLGDQESVDTTSSIIVPAPDDMISSTTSKQISTHTMQQCAITFPIPASS